MPSFPTALTALPFLPLLAAVGLLVSCGSTHKQSDSAPPSLQQRITHPNMKKSSPWEKEFNTANAGDRGGTKLFGKKGYHTDNYGGLKAFGGTKDYQTKSFSQGSKASSIASKSSRMGAQENRMGKTSFATKDSRYSTMDAQQGSQAFGAGDKMFKAGDYQPAAKSLRTNKKLLMEGDSGTELERNANAYDEADVKRLMGR